MFVQPFYTQRWSRMKMYCKPKCKELSAMFKRRISIRWITVVSVNLIVWGAIVSFIIVYHIPRDTTSSSVNEVYNSTEVGSAENASRLLSANGSNNCSDSFYLDDEGNVCLPECGEWAVYPKKLEVAMNTLVILSVVTGIIGGTAVLLLSCINCRRTFTFPSSLIRYQTASVMVFGVVLLIGRTAPTKLFCHSRNLIESLKESAPFCSLIGVTTQYTYCLAIIWWFIHIAAIYWGLKYPFHAHRFETSGKMKYLHFAAILVGFLLPWISIGAVLGAGGHTFANIPPIVCIPSSINVSFYSYIMPIIIVEATGTSLLTIILWMVCKRRKAMANETGIQRVEIKILTVLCYFVGTGIVTFLVVALRFWQNTRPLEDFRDFFTCESSGTSVGEACDRSAIDRNVSNQVLFEVLQMILGSFPAVNLLYAINIRELREKWQHFRYSSKGLI